jgi:hypothetical protein
MAINLSLKLIPSQVQPSCCSFFSKSNFIPLCYKKSARVALHPVFETTIFFYCMEADKSVYVGKRLERGCLKRVHFGWSDSQNLQDGNLDPTGYPCKDQVGRSIDTDDDGLSRGITRISSGDCDHTRLPGKRLAIRVGLRGWKVRGWVKRCM